MLTCVVVLIVQYTSWDNLLGTDYEEDEEKRKELATAPKTLRDGDELVRFLRTMNGSLKI